MIEKLTIAKLVICFKNQHLCSFGKTVHFAIIIAKPNGTHNLPQLVERQFAVLENFRTCQKAEMGKEQSFQRGS